MQPLGEASGEEPPPYICRKAEKHLGLRNRDTTFGIYEGDDYKIGNKKATIFNNNIEIEGEIFKGTPGLWELLTSKNPQNYNDDDYENYDRLMLKTNALHRDNDPNNPCPKSSKS